MPNRIEAAAVLADWRAVERELRAVPVGTLEAEALQAEALRLRNEYQRLVQDPLDHGRPALPPFPLAEEPASG